MKHNRYEYPDSPRENAQKNFQADKPLIHELLAGIERQELDFFWATGRTLSNNPSYQESRDVAVGGDMYGQLFFTYVDYLLENAPAHLKIRFISDDLTKAANLLAIEHLQIIYGEHRFKVVSIEDVSKKIINSLGNDENQRKILQVIFKNATAGNPVSASDFYRVFGMIFGHDIPQKIEKAQYTFSDIDTFCFGMEHKNHRDLINALFSQLKNATNRQYFYIDKSDKNIDIIKIKINDLSQFKEFCLNFIAEIDLSKHNSILSYFSELHEIIKTAETDIDTSLEQLKQLRILGDEYASKVMRSSGPYFWQTLTKTPTLKYPEVYAGAWRIPDEKFARVDESAADFFKHRAGPPELLDTANKFNSDVEQYRKFLLAAHYAKRFGSNHPFNLMMTKYLQDHYPYRTDLFMQLAKLNFQFLSKDRPQKFRLERLVQHNLDNESYKMMIAHDRFSMYLKKEDKNIRYMYSGVNNTFTEGMLDIELSEAEFTALFEPSNEQTKVHEAIAQKNIPLRVIKGLDHKEWQNRIEKNFTDKGYYQVLNSVLQEVIKTESSLDPSIFSKKIFDALTES